MNGVFGSKNRRRRPSINITPLIDVMFLLLIFFMVSSTFRETMGIDITLPQAEQGRTTEQATHEIAVGETGDIWFDGERVAPPELKRRIEAALAAEPGAGLKLQADDAAPFQKVVTAIDVARAAGGDQLVISTRPPDRPAE